MLVVVWGWAVGGFGLVVVVVGLGGLGLVVVGLDVVGVDVAVVVVGLGLGAFGLVVVVVGLGLVVVVGFGFGFVVVVVGGAVVVVVDATVVAGTVVTGVAGGVIGTVRGVVVGGAVVGGTVVVVVGGFVVAVGHAAMQTRNVVVVDGAVVGGGRVRQTGGHLMTVKVGGTLVCALAVPPRRGPPRRTKVAKRARTMLAAPATIGGNRRRLPFLTWSRRHRQEATRNSSRPSGPGTRRRFPSFTGLTPAPSGRWRPARSTTARLLPTSCRTLSFGHCGTWEACRTRPASDPGSCPSQGILPPISCEPGAR